ncbi:MAG: 3-deoxy-8-phosphooctulonate synthase [Phycisphaeraceae bacterium]|nr:3-deoxy-8-phosphooctulonate synthase [Phycisphaeraceae bacterium]
MSRTCRVGSIEIGPGKPLAIIAGPCVLESLDLGMQVARHVSPMCARLGLSYIFKASFDKANRSSITSPRGPGLEKGLRWLTDIRTSMQLPVTTDIHEPAQAEPVARELDLLQIPAFLCRQTDLLQAAGASAGRHNRAVNVKKGQFLSPREMSGPVRKLDEAGCRNVLITERGTFFGYHRLVNDFVGVGELMSLAVPQGAPPVCFDCTHSTQLPGLGEQTGGQPAFSPLLARAAVAAGVHAVFLECHPDPRRALSDASTQLRLDDIEPLLASLAAIHQAIAPWASS